MEEHVYLAKPSMELEEAYLSFYREWKDSGENMVPWVISKDPEDFEAMIRSLEDQAEGKGLPEGWVPDSTYWLVGEDMKVLGAVNIRHSLTEQLKNAGGHIGYGIRPSERRKGYATRLLALSLEKAGEIGIGKVLVVCDEDNIASAKTIQNNGGVPDDDYVEEDGNIVKRFWIDVSGE
ncbi:GNAT family N-acetyltransferase [Bacillus marinisedimentorum]|uniref:GNAT family N-acetyltransferase n=1 Tax=Bacillus marinisedimentorum TaxID=1821260 RepID=UPI000871BB94|nr:GNAT family N-acetyltransferase [Bacillus marinisedimentorum]